MTRAEEEALRQYREFLEPILAERRETIEMIADQCCIRSPSQRFATNLSSQQEETMEIDSSKIVKARKVMADAFKADPDFRHGYVANVAMLMHDRGWLKRPNKDREEAAEAILDLIFEDKR